MVVLSNEQQIAARHNYNSICVIVACPGSGKTTTIAQRCADLFSNTLVDQQTEKVVATSFTTAAAFKLAQTIETYLPEQHTLETMTMHSLCSRGIREYGERIGIPDNFHVYDKSMTDFAHSVLSIQYRLLVSQERITKRFIHPEAAVDMQETLRARLGLAVEEEIAASLLIAIHDTARGHRVGKQTLDSWLRVIGEENAFARSWRAILRLNQLIDFGMMIELGARLFREHPDVVRAMGIVYLFIDEFQDCGAAECSVIESFVGIARGITLVGDFNQSIFQFRDARTTNHESPAANMLTRLRDRGVEIDYLNLSESYRCNEGLIKLSNSILKQVTNRVPASRTVVSGPLPVVVGFDNPELEMAGVIRFINILIAGSVPAEMIAVVYRINKDVNRMRDELLSRGINCTVQSGNIRGLIQRQEPTDLLTILRLALGVEDVRDYCVEMMERIRVPGRDAVDLGFVLDSVIDDLEVGTSSLGKVISDMAERLLYFEYLMHQGDRGDRRHFVEKIVKFANDFERLSENHVNKLQMMETFVQRAKTASSKIQTQEEIDTEKVRMSTIHGCKGHEYFVTFVCGVNYNSYRSDQADPWTLAEMAHMLYVAVTRSLSTTCISYSVKLADLIAQPARKARIRREYLEVYERCEALSRQPTEDEFELYDGRNLAPRRTYENLHSCEMVEFVINPDVQYWNRVITNVRMLRRNETRPEPTMDRLERHFQVSEIKQDDPNRDIKLSLLEVARNSNQQSANRTAVLPDRPSSWRRRVVKDNRDRAESPDVEL